ncbi:MAG TPA: MIP family channel protein [Planctomycetaceae bacterium]|nr:MIP family channel protein [Planctomycetaceae bacterium]
MRGLTREMAAEFFGTFILVVFGTAVDAQVILSKQQNGQYLSINLGWGLGVMMGMYVAGGISGAHLNPAVSLALAVQKKFAWGKVIPYWIMQVAGAFAAAAVTYLVYAEALSAFDNGVRTVPGYPLASPTATAGIFATYPAQHLSTVPGGLIDQIVGTALLIACIFGITDKKNIGLPPYLAPLGVGALVVLIGMTFGFNAGYAINPARDFGPRLFTAVAGWGKAVFLAGDPKWWGWWWVPIVGPLAGGVLGAFLYDFFIRPLARPQAMDSTQP